jgi:hypothetical protein
VRHAVGPELAVGLGLLLACAAARAESDIEKLRKACWEGKRRACTELAKVATDPRERAAAVKQLTDQAVLTRFATTDAAPEVRAAAAVNLTDQARLATVARNDADSLVRTAAIRKLTNEALLELIVRTDSSWVARQAAVRGISDQGVLTTIARTDRDSTVRKAAVERLTNQVVLSEIARTDGEAHQVAVNALIGGPAVEACTCPPTSLSSLLEGGRLRVEWILDTYAQLHRWQEADLKKAGDDAVKSSLLVLGLNPGDGEVPAEVIAQITVVGDYVSAKYSRDTMARSGSERYSGARWTGALSIFHAGECIYSRRIVRGIAPPQRISEDAYKMESEAPLEGALMEWVGGAMVKLAEDLFGQAGVTRLAQSVSGRGVREAAERRLEELGAKPEQR